MHIDGYNSPVRTQTPEPVAKPNVNTRSPRGKIRLLEGRVNSVRTKIEEAKAAPSPNRKRASISRLKTEVCQNFTPPRAVEKKRVIFAKEVPQRIIDLMKLTRKFQKDIEELVVEIPGGQSIAKDAQQWVERGDSWLYEAIPPVGEFSEEHPVSERELLNIERIFSVDPISGPFVQDVRKLLQQLKNEPKSVSLLGTLLHRVLGNASAQEKLTVQQGKNIVSFLKFTLHANPGLLMGPADNFEDVLSEIKLGTKLHVAQENLLYLNETKRLSDSQVYSMHGLRIVLLPQLIAKLLLASDGLNLGFADFVVEHILPSPPQQDAVDHHIVETLRKICDNPTIIRELENIDDVSLLGEKNVRMINAVLRRPNQTPISPRDVRLVLLSSCLTWWRQEAQGNCSIVALYEQTQETNLEWLVKDFKDLLWSQGKMVRLVSGAPSVFVGLEWAESICTQRPFSRDNAAAVYQVESVQNACRLLNCTSEREFLEVVPHNETITLNVAFNRLKERSQMPAESARLACWVAEAPSQALLPRLWENAVGGMYWPKADVPYVSQNVDSCGGHFLIAVVKAFVSVATSRKDKLLTERLKTLEHALSDMSPGRVGSVQDPLLAVFKPLRGFLVPQGEDEDALSWAMHVVDGNSFVPITSKQDFAEILRKKYAECYEQAYGAITRTSVRTRLLQKISPKILADAFATIVRKKKFFCSSGYVFHSVFCLSMEGAESPAVRTGERSFSFSSESKPTEIAGEKREALLRIIKTAKQAQLNAGLDPSLTLLAVQEEHVSRFLPNHPTMMRAVAQGDEWIRVHEDVATPVRDIRASTTTLLNDVRPVLEDLEKWLEADPRIEERGLCQRIESEVKQSLPDEVSIYQFIWVVANAVSAIREEAFSGVLSSAKEKGIRLQLMLALAEGRFPYEDPLLYFEDSNWKREIDGKCYALRHAMWFDPIEMQWEEIRVAEGAPVSSLSVNVCKDGPISSEMEVHSATEAVASYARGAESLSRARAATESLISQEGRYEKVWKKLKKSPSPELQEQCENIRQSYQKTLATNEGVVPEEIWRYRVSFLQRKSEVLRQLSVVDVTPSVT